jgi:hypothetical protein
MNPPFCYIHMSVLVTTSALVVSEWSEIVTVEVWVTLATFDVFRFPID